MRKRLLIAFVGGLAFGGYITECPPAMASSVVVAETPMLVAERPVLVADRLPPPVVVEPTVIVPPPVVVAPAVAVPPPIVVLPPDTRMPVTVDYYFHRRILHRPSRRRNGRVSPIPRGPGHEHYYGPESRAEPMEGSPARRLRAELAGFRSREPTHAGSFLALSRRKRTAKADAGDPADGDAGDFGAPSRGVQGQNGGYRLNFEDADVRDVLHAVLGNVLGLTYTVAPNVTGRITVSSSAPQSRSELLSTLETVLSLQGLSLTKVGSTYRVAPTAVGGGTVDANGQEPGFGISVVPLEYSSAATVGKLLSGFVTEADGVRVDESQNAIVVRGPGPRREEIVRAIRAIDGDWMHRQAVSVVELKRSRPDEVIAELDRIFDNDTSASQPPSVGGVGGIGGIGGAHSGGAVSAGVIQFRPIKRLRAIMVISKNPALVKRAGQWIRRLDHEDVSATPSVFVYRPRYRDAKELTRLVKNLFGGGGGGGADTGAGSGVSFQSAAGGSGVGQAAGSSQPGGGAIGSSSSSFAGGLSSSGLGGGGGGGIGTSSGIGGAPSSSGGQHGGLAEPIEAGQGGAGGNLRLSADTSNNTIVAYTDGETYSKVHAVLRSLDVAPLQVAISVIVAEVQLNDELKYGVQFYLNSNKGSIGLGQVLSSTAGAASTAIAPQFAGFNFLAGGASSPNVVLSALDSVSKVHILSTPSVVVMENKPATFEVGNQVPIITQQATSTLTAGAPTLNQVTYLDTGIILKIVPRVGTHGDVDMSLDQIISSVVPDPTGAQSLTPTISKRRIASDISVRSGQAVLLAGLINDTRQQQKGQIPFIGESLGDIFGNRDNQFNRSELVVFIRPVIIRDGKDAQYVAEEFKSHLKAMDLHPPRVTK